MSGGQPPFFGWPGWRHLGRSVLLSLAQLAWFVVVFGGADWITANHSFRVRVHLPGELDVPFVPQAVLGYMSIYLLFLAAPFVLRTAREVTALTCTLMAVTGVAGVCFLVLPVDNLFPTPREMGAWTAPVSFAKWLALRYNMLPSLHVALSVCCIAALARRAGLAGRLLLWTWAVVIGWSTILLHQHYLADVIAGFALGSAGYRFGYRRWSAESPTNTTSTSPRRERARR
jgi:membrane-associated phospholipid phosphatase